MQNTNYSKMVATVFSFVLLVLPAVVYGAGLGLIPCGNPQYVLDGVTIPAQPPCDFNYLIVMANNIIHFLMIDIAVPLAALGFMYAGARMVLFQNKEAEVTKTKEIALDIVKGFAIILGAYVLIKTILFAFLNTGEGFTLFLIQ